MSFTSPGDFRAWLAKNHNQSDGILAAHSFYKDSSVANVTYAEALDQALCFGWIDGQKKPFDRHSWLQKFTPRRPRSAWSKNNTRHAERLIKSGEMAPSGHREVKAAKADGRWKAAYDFSAAPPFRMISWRSSLKTRRQKFSLRRSTRPICIQLLIVSRPQKNLKPETGGCRPS